MSNVFMCMFHTHQPAAAFTCCVRVMRRTGAGSDCVKIRDCVRIQAGCRCQGVCMAGQAPQHSACRDWGVVLLGGLSLDVPSARDQTRLSRGTQDFLDTCHGNMTQVNSFANCTTVRGHHTPGTVLKCSPNATHFNSHKTLWRTVPGPVSQLKKLRRRHTLSLAASFRLYSMEFGFMGAARALRLTSILPVQKSLA